MIFEYCPINFSSRILVIFVYITNETLKPSRTHKKISSSLGLKISHIIIQGLSFNPDLAVTCSQTNKYNMFIFIVFTYLWVTDH